MKRHLASLLGLASKVPPRLESVAGAVAELVAAQDKAIRHLRSINRKLTAFGVAAKASNVKVPPPPEEAPAPSIDANGPAGLGC